MNGDLTSPAPPPAQQNATARDFVAVVFRRKWLIIGLFVIVTATVLVVSLASPARYTSSGRVLVKRGEQESVMSPGRRFTGWEEELATEAQVIRSWAVRQRAQQWLARETDPEAPAVRLDPAEIEVQVIGQSNVIEIAYVDGHPRVAHRACDAVINGYVEYRSNSETLPYPRTFFEGELKRVGAAIDSLSRVRRNFAESQQVVDIDEQRRAMLQTLHQLMHERSQATADLAEQTGSLHTLASLREDPDMDMPVFGAGFLNEGALVELKTTMVQQETRIAQLQERYRDDAPELADARAALESMKALLRREVAQRVKLAQAKVQGLRSRVDTLDRQITAAQAALTQIPGDEARLDDLDQKLAVLKTRNLALVEDSDHARVTEQTSRRVSVVVLTPASAPRVLRSRDYVRLALAPAFSLVVGIGLAFFVDGLDTRLRTTRDLEDSVDLPVLASLNERKG